MRKEPLRLEVHLTRDYINRAQKLAEIERYMQKRVISPAELLAYWVVLGIAVTIGLLMWVLQ